VDYGGGLFIKQTVFVTAIAYLLTKRSSYAIWAAASADLSIVIGLPFLITLCHLILTPQLRPEIALAELWTRLGSPSYFLLLPLIYALGSKRTAVWLVRILGALALATIVLMVAHVLGLINIFDYTEFMVNRRLALFGLDTRASELGLTDVTVPAFGASQTFPVIFPLAFVLHPALSLIIVLATLLGTQRGQVLGLLVALLIVLAGSWWTIPAMVRRIWRQPTRAFIALAVLAPVAALCIYVINKSSDAFILLSSKYSSLLSGQDESSLIRAAHLVGYWDTVRASPQDLVWGVGPGASFYNAVSGDQVFMTEMVILIYAFWYGWLYTLAFYAWLVTQLYLLARMSRDRFDKALVAACAVLVIIGNINPVMLTPLAFIFLAMLRCRRFEIRSEGTAAANPRLLHRGDSLALA
jgi:hypothetical protein